MGIPIDQQLAYDQGAKARRAGVPVADNPYVIGRTAQSWTAGWRRADAEALAREANPA